MAYKSYQFADIEHTAATSRDIANAPPFGRQNILRLAHWQEFWEFQRTVYDAIVLPEAPSEPLAKTNRQLHFSASSRTQSQFCGQSFVGSAACASSRNIALPGTAWNFRSDAGSHPARVSKKLTAVVSTIGACHSTERSRSSLSSKSARWWCSTITRSGRSPGKTRAFRNRRAVWVSMFVYGATMIRRRRPSSRARRIRYAVTAVVLPSPTGPSQATKASAIAAFAQASKNIARRWLRSCSAFVSPAGNERTYCRSAASRSAQRGSDSLTGRRPPSKDALSLWSASTRQDKARRIVRPWIGRAGYLAASQHTPVNV